MVVINYVTWDFNSSSSEIFQKMDYSHSVKTLIFEKKILCLFELCWWIISTNVFNLKDYFRVTLCFSVRNQIAKDKFFSELRCYGDSSVVKFWVGLFYFPGVTLLLLVVLSVKVPSVFLFFFFFPDYLNMALKQYVLLFQKYLSTRYLLFTCYSVCNLQWCFCGN